MCLFTDAAVRCLDAARRFAVLSIFSRSLVILPGTDGAFFAGGLLDPVCTLGDGAETSTAGTGACLALGVWGMGDGLLMWSDSRWQSRLAAGAVSVMSYCRQTLGRLL